MTAKDSRYVTIPSGFFLSYGEALFKRAFVCFDYIRKGHLVERERAFKKGYAELPGSIESGPKWLAHSLGIDESPEKRAFDSLFAELRKLKVNRVFLDRIAFNRSRAMQATGKLIIERRSRRSRT